jgi:uncharacterized protein (TIGR02996 family)
MTTESGFLADIIAHPADDTPRLIYADWLDEHGQGERAEFIRVQVELARLDAEAAAVAPMALLHTLKTREALRRRERELLEAHYVDWINQVHANGFTSTFCRGFVASMTCRLADWCGEACRRCAGDGQAHGADRPFEWSGPDSYPGRCPVCHGTGHTGGHGPALVRAAALERVTFSCDTVTALPLHGNWVLSIDLSRGLVVLPPSFRVPQDGFASKDAALAALSHAALAWAHAVNRRPLSRS